MGLVTGEEKKMSWSHKDPSGTLNKARWILNICKRDSEQLRLAYDSVTRNNREKSFRGVINTKSYKILVRSWEAAFVIADYCILHDVENPSNVFNSLNFNFKKGISFIQGDRRWYDVLLDHFNSFNASCLKEDIVPSCEQCPSLNASYTMYKALVKSGNIKPNCFLKTTAEHMNSIKCHALEKKYNAPWRK